jgi:allophanate hydrolase
MTGTPCTIAALRESYRSRRSSPVEIARECLGRIAAYADPAVWISRTPDEQVMARARALESARDRIDDMPLYGIPFAVKDNIDATGFPTTAGCPAFAYTPQKDSHVVARLLASGAILMGKTNLDQFATGLVGTRSPYGAPRCVFDPRYVSGGSSSGSAVAVAAGLVTFSLGTDTAGSGRVPAAFNNIVGLKPTCGLISTWGVVPACRSLDCVSIFARDAADADAVLRVVQGFNEADDYSRGAPPLALPAKGLRIGILAPAYREFFGDASSAALYENAIDRFAALGATPVTIDWAPFRDAGALLYGGAWTAERLAAIKDFMAKHEDAMDPAVRAIIAGARTLSAADAFEGQYRLSAYRRAAGAQWARMDVLLLPTAPTQDTVDAVNADPIAMNAKLGRYTNFVNLLDCCAIAVPAGFRANGLPFGVTLVAPAFCDAALADLAARFLGEKPISRAASPDGRIPLFVVGAHLSGMPLNRELVALGAGFVRDAKTAARYRLFVLPDTKPAKPGMIAGHGGASIAGEIWRLPPDAFGRFVAAIPSPLGIGKVRLDDGSEVSGFLCEASAVDGAVEITRFGSWRAYLESSS